MKKYTEESIQTELKEFNEWRFVDNKLEKKFKFIDFSEALGFIVRVGLVAERNNHHPELFNVSNNVIIRLTTHDADGVTDKDIDLAKNIERIFVK